MSVHQIKRELIAWTVVYDLCVESLNPVAGHAKTVYSIVEEEAKQLK